MKYATILILLLCSCRVHPLNDLHMSDYADMDWSTVPASQPVEYGDVDQEDFAELQRGKVEVTR